MSKSGHGLGDTLKVSRQQLLDKNSKSPTISDGVSAAASNFGLFSTINVSPNG